MSKSSDIVSRLGGLHGAIGSALSGFGGFVRCETCRTQWSIDDELAARYTRSGWPKCCGYTMMWWTRRQIDAGEVPA